MAQRHRQRRSKSFLLPVSDLSKQSDILFVGADGEFLGEVTAKASPEGQRALQNMFPGCRIGWREVEGADKRELPEDWREFCFIVPQLVNIPCNGLPIDLLYGKPISEIGPDQFAFFMMVGANRQGARAAILSDGKLIQLATPSQCN